MVKKKVSREKPWEWKGPETLEELEATLKHTFEQIMKARPEERVYILELFQCEALLFIAKQLGRNP